MDERSQVLLSALLGAVVGAVVGALYLTERGRRVRDQIDPALDGFMTELERARGGTPGIGAERGVEAFRRVLLAPLATALYSADCAAGVQR